MNRWLKWSLRGLGGLALLLVIAAGYIYVSSESRLTRNYAIAPEAVSIPTDPALLEAGKHIATISGCVDCHGSNLAGRVFFENAMVGRFVASNLTGGKGGVGGEFTDADWVRAIRHGVRPNGKPLLVMPAREYYALSDGDLGMLIEYIKSAPPVDNTLPKSEISPMGRVLMLALKDMPILAAERIDHSATRRPVPEKRPTKEYGDYLAVRCTGCHGDHLSGGKIPGTPPDWPIAPNLTPSAGAAIATWTQEQFVHAMRTGMTPAGKQLNSKYMPWPVLGQMTDEELTALWLSLKAMPQRELGNR